MRLTAFRVDGKKESVDADKTVSMNANIMKEDIEKYAELPEVYTSPPSPGTSWTGTCNCMSCSCLVPGLSPAAGAAGTAIITPVWLTSSKALGPSIAAALAAAVMK